MFKRLTALVLALLIPACAFALEGGVIMYISAPTSDRVHLRAQPSSDSASLGLYFTGTPLKTGITDTITEWVKVRIGAGEGYMHTGCIAENAPASAAPARVVANPHSTWVHLRQGPSTSTQSLGRYDNGTLVRLLGETADGWSYVDMGDMTGYMLTSMLGSAPDAAPAPAVTAAPAAVETNILGFTSQGNYIHAYAAPNGQYICFDAMEEYPYITEEDVNFDGRADLVVLVSMGASNAWYEFFVFDGTRYQHVEHPGSEYGLPNYVLYPQQGLVGTHASNGSAGALHENCLYRWEGDQLKMIRRAVSEEYAETEFLSDRYVSTTWNDRIRFRVYENSPETGEGTIVFDETVHTSQLDGDIFDREDAALWQGLR